MHLIFIGMPGSGKGIQARSMVKNYGFVMFETGGLLRKFAQQDTLLGKKIKKIIEAGKHVPSQVIEKLLDDFIKAVNSKKIIFDGLVRNLENKQIADKKLDPDYKVIYFDLPEEVALKRLLGRMYNPKTGETFPPGTEFDPKTGDKLIKRADDNENSIKQRIKEFYEKTLPVIKLYEKTGKLVKINANQPIDNITQEILKNLFEKY